MEDILVTSLEEADVVSNDLIKPIVTALSEVMSIHPNPASAS